MVKYWCVKARKDMGNSVGAGQEDFPEEAVGFDSRILHQFFKNSS